MTRFPIVVSLVLLALVPLLSACGSTEKRLEQPRHEIAEVRGAIPEFKLLGMTHSILFTSVDGVPFEKSFVKSLPDVIDVMPGKRKIGMSWSVKFDGQPGPNDETWVELDAVAGKTYQAELKFQEGKGHWIEFLEVDAATLAKEAEPKPRQESY